MCVIFCTFLLSVTVHYLCDLEMQDVCCICSLHTILVCTCNLSFGCKIPNSTSTIHLIILSDINSCALCLFICTELVVQLIHVILRVSCSREDPSHSLLKFVPQENRNTVKLARLQQRNSSPQKLYTLLTSYTPFST